MTAHALIHVGLKQLGIAGDDARDLYERVTGARSLRAMTPPQHQAVVDELHRLGFKRSSRSGSAKRATGPYAGKLQALWIAGYNLGVVRDKTDAAMIAFLKRQTDLDHHRFLREAADANRAIDALKLWIRRATGNDGLFRKDRSLPDLYNDFRFQIVLHIWSELIKRNAAPAGTLTAWLIQTIGNMPTELTAKQWIAAQNRLGKLLREVKK
ncbi:regulatory protein GemA [Polymorphum gilvum]|uniref:Mu-like prophage protein gp16 n=1 Tax=Polymorphum gilvum (strain LMG 25793 / CGMCC 1.9160 / SL003B-26A1) TaxID=991905 RepID=F2J5L5_POLGS|nr:regulatory protein GemA [Polymorphum gilvum]ADZ70099.1 Mu-like prophage protein gp16 [Polymorphum gilvum SL003B-26A1]